MAEPSKTNKDELRKRTKALRPLLNVRLKDLQCDGLSNEEIACILAETDEDEP